MMSGKSQFQKKKNIHNSIRIKIKLNREGFKEWNKRKLYFNRKLSQSRKFFMKSTQHNNSYTNSKDNVKNRQEINTDRSVNLLRC